MNHSLSNLRGAIVAMVTPFDEAGQIDFGALDQLIDWHIDSGTHGIVVAGTTGETPNLTEAEYISLVGHVANRVQEKIPVIAGAGTNSTAESQARAHLAQEQGADGLLVVTPYYNKPTQSGLLAHFGAIAESTELPIIAYNVPGRTGCNLLPDTLIELFNRHPNLIGVKEASGNLEQIMTILHQRPPKLRVFSGDDVLALPVVQLGGEGCISVVANQIPAAFSRLMTTALEGNHQEALTLHYRYLKLMQLNFVESNPIPVKTALALMGRAQETFRLPLSPMQPENRLLLKKELQHLGLLKAEAAA